MKAVVIGIAAVVTMLTLAGILHWRASDHVVAAGFWFDDGVVALGEFEIGRLGGALTTEERSAVEARAWSELRAAYAGLRIAFSERRDTTYRVHVVSDVARHPWAPFKTPFGAAGESRVAWPVGGFGTVSFRVVAGNAVAYAPAGADRATIVEGIGTGLGRVAAHEFAHQLLSRTPLDASADVQSYEYWTAGRPEQYYGPMHWDFAWPLLVERVGAVSSTSR